MRRAAWTRCHDDPGPPRSCRRSPGSWRSAWGRRRLRPAPPRLASARAADARRPACTSTNASSRRMSAVRCWLAAARAVVSARCGTTASSPSKPRTECTSAAPRARSTSACNSGSLARSASSAARRSVSMPASADPQLASHVMSTAPVVSVPAVTSVRGPAPNSRTTTLPDTLLFQPDGTALICPSPARSCGPSCSRPDHRALGQPRRPGHGPAGRVGPPSPAFLLRAAIAKRRAQKHPP